MSYHREFAMELDIRSLERKLKDVKADRDFWKGQAEALAEALQEAREVPIWHAKDSTVERMQVVITKGIEAHRAAVAGRGK